MAAPCLSDGGSGIIADSYPVAGRTPAKAAVIRGHVPAFRSAPAGLRLTRQALGGQLVEVVAPVGVLMTPEIEEIFPTVDAGRMQVVEHEPHRIIADRLHFEDRHISLLGNGLALLGRVTLDLGARA